MKMSGMGLNVFYFKYIISTQELKNLKAWESFVIHLLKVSEFQKEFGPKNQRFFLRISALAWGRIKKINALYITN